MPLRRRRDDGLRAATDAVAGLAELHLDAFGRVPYLAGFCNVCGRGTVFLCPDGSANRESTICAECRTTSRYRSLARGILRAVRELTGIEAESLAALAGHRSPRQLRVYDTQTPFRWAPCAYPIPEILRACSWIEVDVSSHTPHEPWGAELGPSHTNQSLERLTYVDASFDVVLTSDVFEHVRLDDRAHREIVRVLRPGGVYAFTVAHHPGRETVERVRIVDPDDPASDVFVLEPEYHGDANSIADEALVYRRYGSDLLERLASLGLAAEFEERDFPALGIIDSEIYYCRRQTDEPSRADVRDDTAVESRAAQPRS